MRSVRPLFVVAAIGLGSCSATERPSSTSDVGGTMVIAGVGDAGDLFPPLVNEANARIVQEAVFDRLAEIGPDMATVGDAAFSPRLARSWTWAPDSLSIAFSLDPRAHWHDGKPVTAADIRYSFRIFTDPKLASPTGPLLANVDSVSVRDSATAVAWFKKRTPEQFYDVAYNLIPVPEHVYGSIPAEQMRTSEAIRTLVGSGRFRFVKWEPKVRIELVADTANYRGRAKLDRVIITPVSDPSAGVAQILSGQADFMEAFPIDQVTTLDGSKVARPMPFPNLGYAFLGFNPHQQKNSRVAHPIFGDARVRRALAMGLDRQAMLHNVFGNLGRIGHGPFPSTIAAADTTLRLPAYDTTTAKALLDSAGWKTGPDGVRVKNGQRLQFGLISPATSLFRRRYAVLIQDQLRRLGAQVDLDTPDNNTFQARTTSGAYDAQLGAYNVDPSVSGAKQNWSTAAIGAGGLNTLAYSNPKVDALLDSATTLFDPKKAKAASSKAFQMIIDDVPAIFLYDVVVVDAVNRRFRTPPMRADGWFVNLPEWSVAPDQRIDRDRIGLAAAKP